MRISRVFLALAMVTTKPLAAWGVPPESESTTVTDPQPSPNVLLLVWDSVRVDHLSLAGYSRDTTPRLNEWAQKALVFDNALATSNASVATHASIFTGRLPSEHDTHDARPRLPQSLTTIGEWFEQAGYQTHFFSANPHLVEAQGFTQGFGVHEHPWQEPWRGESLRRLQRKVRSGAVPPNLVKKLRKQGPNPWLLKDSAPLAQESLLRFLRKRDTGRPWLSVVNSMEAHRPWFPSRRSLRQFLTSEEVDQYQEIDLTWNTVWRYNFRLGEYSAEEMAVLRGVYDAAIFELDAALAQLLKALEDEGFLDNTIVVLTSDHGELLGEHHFFGHQFSLHSAVARVPLILFAPGRVEPGRSNAPVTTMDLYSTLAHLASLEPPKSVGSHARSLLEPLAERPRLLEYPSIDPHAVESMRALDSDFDVARWSRSLRCLVADGYEFIEGGDGHHELYHLAEDPAEEVNLVETHPEIVERMQSQLIEMAQRFEPAPKR